VKVTLQPRYIPITVTVTLSNILLKVTVIEDYYVHSPKVTGTYGLHAKLVTLHTVDLKTLVT
jgi:hypothetical protein